jgi:hypothetical protein
MTTQLLYQNKDIRNRMGEIKEMSRLIAALLLAGCLTMQVWAQVAPGRGSTEQTPAAQPAPGGQAAAAPAATPMEPSDFPLHKLTDFSAVMVGSVSPADDEEVHIYRSGDLMRMEGRLHVGYYITNLKTEETHALSNRGCMKMGHPYTHSFPFVAGRPGSKVERAAVGKETVDGHVCQVEDFNITPPNGGNPVKLRLWEAEDLRGFPVQVEMRGSPLHRRIQYKNVVLGPQDPTLFIYPKVCKQLNVEEPGGKPAASPKAKKPPAHNSKQ